MKGVVTPFVAPFSREHKCTSFALYNLKTFRLLEQVSTNENIKQRERGKWPSMLPCYPVSECSGREVGLPKERGQQERRKGLELALSLPLNSVTSTS